MIWTSDFFCGTIMLISERGKNLRDKKRYSGQITCGRGLAGAIRRQLPQNRKVLKNGDHAAGKIRYN